MKKFILSSSLTTTNFNHGKIISPQTFLLRCCANIKSVTINYNAILHHYINVLVFIYGSTLGLTLKTKDKFYRKSLADIK